MLLQYELSVGFYLILMGQHTINRELADFLTGMDSSLPSSVVATERQTQRKIIIKNKYISKSAK